jgi:hypothetical protein
MVRDQAMTGLLGWKRVRLRGWSGTKCGTVMWLSSCGCAVGAERSAAAVEMELGKRRVHKLRACALNVLGMRCPAETVSRSTEAGEFSCSDM